MKPLQTDAHLLKLCSQHPDSAVFRDAVVFGSALSHDFLVRLWLTEGIPFAFRECPAVYEAARAWLGWRLGVYPKEITLLGSARIGFSLSPPPKYGQAFGPDSDLDLSVVSESLFQKMVETFNQWHADYERCTVQPRHQTEQGYWDQNIKVGQRSISNSFLDANKIPNLGRYPVAQDLNQAMWELKKKLEVTPGAPNPRKASVRVYTSWPALVSRVSFNLRFALRTR
jgi:hypothetical protein